MATESGTNGVRKLRLVAGGNQPPAAAAQDQIDQLYDEDFLSVRHLDEDQESAAILRELINREIEKAKRQS